MGTRVVRVAINGYGVIGKRVADAVSLQDDMTLAGVADVVTDYRIRTAVVRGLPLLASTADAGDAMRQAGLPVKGRLEDLLGQTDVVVDCTPKKVAARNRELYAAHSIPVWEDARVLESMEEGATGDIVIPEGAH